MATTGYPSCLPHPWSLGKGTAMGGEDGRGEGEALVQSLTGSLIEGDKGIHQGPGAGKKQA